LAQRPDLIRIFAAGARRVLRRAALVVVVAGVRPLAAQGPLDALTLDKLELTSLGFSFGRILPSQIEPANIYAVSSDYGEFARSWRAILGVSYFGSRYRDVVVQTFVDSLNRSLLSAGSNATVVSSRISLYDVTFSAEARYTPIYSGEIKPYFGLGFAAHVINAEGRLIDGTFVERALDNIASGIFVTGGFSVKLVRHFGIEGGARADLLSGFRSTQVRAGAAYYFGHIRGAPPDQKPSGNGTKNGMNR
jgi:hypothetical protein